MRTAGHLLTLAEGGMDHARWYTHALADIKSVCEREEWDHHEFIDILAITSPRVSVRRNIRVALHYMRTSNYLSGTIKATRAAMKHYEATGEIRGPKTSAFAAALKGNLDAVVLDVWMSQAFEIDQRLFSRKPVREECCRRVIRAAKRIGLCPAELQAAVWAGTVRRHGRNVPSFTVSDELTLFD